MLNTNLEEPRKQDPPKTDEELRLGIAEYMGVDPAEIMEMPDSELIAMMFQFANRGKEGKYK